MKIPQVHLGGWKPEDIQVALLALTTLSSTELLMSVLASINTLTVTGSTGIPANGNGWLTLVTMITRNFRGLVW